MEESDQVEEMLIHDQLIAQDLSAAQDLIRQGRATQDQIQSDQVIALDQHRSDLIIAVDQPAVNG